MQGIYTDAGPRRLRSSASGQGIREKLRSYSVGAAVCVVGLVAAYLWHVTASPYPLPFAVPALVAMFGVAAAVLVVGLRRRRWFEAHDAGLYYGGPFGRAHFVPWSAVRDLRYFIGGGLPFSVKVAGRRSALTLGPHHRDLARWTVECLNRMGLDISRGTRLLVIQEPLVYWIGVTLSGLAAVAAPLAVVRAANGAADLLLAAAAVGAAGGLLTLALRRRLQWSPEGVTLGRGRRAQTFPWRTVQAEWRNTLVGTTALDVRLGDAPPLRVLLGQWGAPRFVARLTTERALHRPAQRVRTGLLFPIFLALLTVVAGSQVRSSAQLLGELTPQRLLAVTGVETIGKIVHVERNERGLQVRYAYAAGGRRYQGHGWLLPTAQPSLEQSPFLPVRYSPRLPEASLPAGDPTFFYAVYYAVIAAFHAMLILPLLALWDITPAPAPFALPALAR